MAGIPVYPLRGRGGGWRLVGGARTDLSGLNAEEVRALFLVAGSAAAATPELRAALRKLVRALPEPFRKGAEASAASLLVDPGGWGQSGAPRRPRHLDALQSACVDGVRVRLGYSDRSERRTERVVDPLGVALKGTAWYLVAGTDEGLRSFRISRVRSVNPTAEPVVRPEGFDLAGAWRSIVEQVDHLRFPVAVTILVDPSVVEVLRWLFEGHVEIGNSSENGRIYLTLRGRRIDIVVAQLTGFGRQVEIVSPDDARSQAAQIGRELVDLYRS